MEWMSGSRSPIALVGRLAGALVGAGILSAAVLLPFVGGAGLLASKAAGDFVNTTCDLTITPAAQTSTIYASDDTTPIATLYAQNRRDVPLTQVPKPVQDALISTEDRRFYEHHGVDLHGLVRAAVSDSTGGGDTQGGSTLTMQYVKQVRYYQASTAAGQAAAVEQNLDRKVQDAKCAIDLEKKYTKDQILDDYFNIAFFGENSYGIQVAAETYFGVPAAKLTVPQGAMLVGLLQSPSALDPFNDAAAARTRRNVVLDNMVANGKLSAADATKYKATGLGLAGKNAPAASEGCAATSSKIANAGFFCDYVLDWLQNTGGLSRRTIETGGLKIVTTLDVNLQNNGQQAVWNSGLDTNSPTALVMPSVDPKTGHVTSMITSRHYGVGPGQTTLPLFTSAYAGAGSTYKYFTAITALKLGVQPDFTLTTNNSYTTKNCPVTDPKPIANAGSYRPTLPLQDALPESVNTYFVGMEDQLFGCNIAPIVQTAQGLGMNALNTPTQDGKSTYAKDVVDQNQAGFTLGFASTSALELTGAYSAMANDGVFCPPTPVLGVTNSAGKAVTYKTQGCSRQFSPQVARTLESIMVKDTNSYLGTAGSYFSQWYANGGSPIASKTGTNNDRSDQGNSALWYVGVTPTLTSAAALVNPSDPAALVSGLPSNVTNNGSDVFGAYAATFWLDAYQPTLSQQSWSWPAADDVPNPVSVPNLLGQSPDEATTTLQGLGLTASVSTVVCGSGEPAGTVGYYGPRTVSAGDAVTLCLSNGTAPTGSSTGYGYNYNYGNGSYGSGGSNSSGNPSGGSTPGSGTPSTGGTGGAGNGGTGNGNGGGNGSPNPKPSGR